MRDGLGVGSRHQFLDDHEIGFGVIGQTQGVDVVAELPDPAQLGDPVEQCVERISVRDPLVSQREHFLAAIQIRRQRQQEPKVGILEHATAAHDLFGAVLLREPAAKRVFQAIITIADQPHQGINELVVRQLQGTTCEGPGGSVSLTL